MSAHIEGYRLHQYTKPLTVHATKDEAIAAAKAWLDKSAWQNISVDIGRRGDDWLSGSIFYPGFHRDGVVDVGTASNYGGVFRYADNGL